MKMQLKKILLPMAFVAAFIPQVTHSDIPNQAPTAGAHNGAQQMPTPSVSDIFGGMSEDEIIQQVQEAQKFFDSLSPEEVADLKKMVSQTLKTMSSQDIEDIQGIAKIVNPHLDLEEPKGDDLKTNKKDDTINSCSTSGHYE